MSDIPSKLPSGIVNIPPAHSFFLKRVIYQLHSTLSSLIAYFSSLTFKLQNCLQVWLARESNAEFVALRMRQQVCNRTTEIHSQVTIWVWILPENIYFMQKQCFDCNQNYFFVFFYWRKVWPLPIWLSVFTLLLFLLCLYLIKNFSP